MEEEKHTGACYRGSNTPAGGRAPAVGNLKINVDASVREGEDQYSIGMAVRDHGGRFLAGKTMKFEGRVSVFEAESIGVLEALLWSSSFQDKIIDVETDSLLTVNAIKNGVIQYLELGHIFQQCREILEHRRNLKIEFVKKLANNVAHEMARLPCELNSYKIITSPPQFLLETIMYDSLCC